MLTSLLADFGKAAFATENINPIEISISFLSKFYTSICCLIDLVHCIEDKWTIDSRFNSVNKFSVRPKKRVGSDGMIFQGLYKILNLELEFKYRNMWHLKFTYIWRMRQYIAFVVFMIVEFWAIVISFDLNKDNKRS